MKYFRLLLTSLILSCANAALADDTSVQQKFIDTPVDPQVFVEKAYASGLTEIELANNALQKSTHEEVRHFAQMMIEGHTQINNDLRTLANAEGLNIPSEATLLKKAKARMLALKKGESFESSYAGHQVESHEQSYKLFRQAAKSPNSNIRKFAEEKLPSLEHHLNVAKALVTAVAQTNASENRTAPDKNTP